MKSTNGNVAVMLGLLLPLLALIVGGALDFMNVQRQKSLIQSAADAATLAGAKSLSMSDPANALTPSIVQAVVSSFLTQALANHSAATYTASTDVVTTAGQPLQVQLNITATVKSLMGNIGIGDTNVAISSYAQIISSPNVCIIALDQKPLTITLLIEKNAKVIGSNCDVYANSTYGLALWGANNALLTAGVICSAGGFHWDGPGNFDPSPITDCPQFKDPLAGRPEPSVGPCVATGLVIADQTTTLNPGTYCDGLTIAGASNVTLQPGLYIISDGQFTIDGTSSVTGVDVGFFLKGKGATINFTNDTTIALSGPTTGAMAGLLIFASTSQSNEEHAITSADANTLTGTIYMPTGKLTLGGNGSLGSASAYTAIVVNQLLATAGPTITLNSNYDQTNVPVPEGIRGAGMNFALVK